MLGTRRVWLGGTVAAAAVCLTLGVSLPFMRLTKLAVLGYGAYGHSAISAVSALFRSGQYVLGGMLLVLVLLLPVLKLLYLVLLAALPAAEIGRSASQLRALDWLGRWSAHDLLAFALAAGLLARDPMLSQRADAGSYLFAAAVLLMALAYVFLPGGLRAFRLRAAAARAVHRARGPAFAALAVLAAVALVAGVTLPAVRLSSAYAGTDLHSVSSLAWTLYGRGATIPCVVLLGLAVVLPGLRIVYLLMLALARTMPAWLRNKAVAAGAGLGRYATADAMVLAVLLAYLIAAGEVDAALQPGVYGLVASAGLTLLAHAWINLLPSPAAAARPPSLAARLAGLAAADPAGKP